MNRFAALAVVSGAALLATATTAPTPGRTAAPGVSLPGRVLGLSADGGRVAIRVRTSPRRELSCDRIRIWSPPARATTVINPLDPCRVGEERAERASDLTLAGRQLVWTEYDYGNHPYCTVAGATLTRRKARDLEVCDPESHDPERLLAGFSGDGPLIAFSTWYQCDPYWSDRPECQRNEETQFEVQLWAVVGGKPKILREGLIWRTVVAVDAGRIVLLRPDGAVIVVRSGDGRAYLGFPSPRREWLGARLQGSHLVIKKRAGLAVFDAAAGTAVATFPGTRATRLIDVQDGVILTIASRTLRLRRISDGRQFTLTPPGSGPVYAQLERTGLFYGYNRRGGSAATSSFFRSPQCSAASTLSAPGRKYAQPGRLRAVASRRPRSRPYLIRYERSLRP